MVLHPDDQIYEMVGGKETFIKIAETFYNKIEDDTILRFMFPDNLDTGRKLQYLFLMQKFGGPRDYEKLRGHARLRKRHLKFPIGVIERNQWVKLMLETLEEVGISKDHEARETLEEYFQRVGNKMINKSGDFHVLQE